VCIQFHAFDQETVYLFCGPPLYTVLAIARILSRFRSNAASSEGSSQSFGALSGKRHIVDLENDLAGIGVVHTGRVWKVKYYRDLCHLFAATGIAPLASMDIEARIHLTTLLLAIDFSLLLRGDACPLLGSVVVLLCR
jgi:hypothetical protein